MTEEVTRLQSELAQLRAALDVAMGELDQRVALERRMGAELEAARAVANAVAALILGSGTIAAVRQTGDAWIVWRRENQ